MREFMMILLSLSLSGTLLFMLIYCTAPFYRNKLSRRWQYYIWLIVVLRFLLPFTTENTVTGYLFRGVEQFVRESGINVNSVGDMEEQSGGNSVAYGIQNDAASASGVQSDAVPASEAQGGTSLPLGEQNNTSLLFGSQDNNGLELDKQSDKNSASLEKSADKHMPDIALCLFIIWAAAAFMMFVRKITVYQSYLRFLKSGNKEISDIEILNLLAEKEETMKIKKTIELYQNPMLTSPIMTGFLHPAIIIPVKQTNREELSYIFEHELTHYKYFDIFYKWLVQIVLCIHWFNPFVYLLAKEVNKYCELSCDEKVINALEKHERKEYGDTLLSFMETEQAYQNPLASITLTEGAGQLIERLGAIMDYKKKSKKVKIMTVLLTFMFCVSSTALGAYAKQKDNAYTRSGEVDDTKQTDVQAALKEAEPMEAKPLDEEDDITEDIAGNIAMQDFPSDYSIEQEKTVYYIFAEGADRNKKPSVNFTEGSIGIVLVKQDDYTTLGPFSEIDFFEEVLEQCYYAMEQGYLSEEETVSILKAAREIEDSGFSLASVETMPAVVATRPDAEIPDVPFDKPYIQRGYYQEPYIIEIGWNLSEEAIAYYPDRQKLTLADGSEITVCFAGKAREFMTDAEAMEAVAEIILDVKLKAEEGQWDKWNAMEVERPYIVNIIYLPPEEISGYLEKAWQEDDIVPFAYVFDMLSQEEKIDYCGKAYYEDRIDFFSVLIEEIDESVVEDYCEKAYNEDRIDFFSVLIEYMSETDRQRWMKKTLREGNESFYYLLKYY